MTEVKDAAKRRSVSKGQLTRILKTVEEAINNDTLSRTIIGWMSEARLKWQQVQERHEEYVIAKDGDIEEVEDEQWIHQEAQRFRGIEEKVDCYLEQLDRSISEGEEIKRMKETKAEEDKKQWEKINRQEMEKQKLLKEIILRRKNERQKFDRIKKEIERDVVLEDNIEQMIKLTKDNLNVLLESKRSCEQLQQSYELHGGDMTEDEEITWIERLYDDYYSVSRVAKLFISKYVKEANAGRSNMKLEKLKFEEFDGSFRKYPKFKGDFNKIIRPLYSKEEAAFALRSYLSETVKLEVEYVGDNYEMIWERLDTKYGNESKLIDLIMQDIKCLKISKEDYGQESLKLISIVERAHRDLTVIGREREISNATIVSLLEEKLPKRIEDDWLEIVTGERAKDIDRDKFPALLQLLLKHKSMIEYKSSAIRKSSSSKGAVHLVEEENMHGTVFMNAMDTKNGRCWLHPEDTSHPIWRCQDLLAMSAKDRMEIVREKRACFKCLGLGHAARFCRRLFKCRINDCGKPHHDLLHEAYLPAISLHNKTSENSNVLLQIQNIRCKREDGRRDDINVLWDSGSTLSFITFKKAQSMKLRSKERVNMRITKVGGISEGISTMTFQLTMLDKLNEEVAVTVFGMDKISNNIATIEVEKVKYFFPKVKLKDYNRPLNGEVECLVGFEMAEYHPVKKQSVGNLLLLENNFGLIIGGSHSDITRTTNKVIKEALICHINVRVEDFYSIEKLGVEVFPKCGSCRCGRCHPGGRCMSLKDEREYKMIEDGLNYSEDEKRFIARYPFLKDPRHLPNNRNAVFGMLRSTERMLMRNPLNAKMYQTQIEDMIERKVCKKLEESEIENYTGPMFYLAHHAVIKRESKSTPYRIVFNSSAKFKGNSLNDILAKGPDMLNNLLGVLLRFREERVVIFGDISKMYHSIGVTEFDQMLHCFLWRDFRIEEKPDTYAITVVNFGDRPSATIALCALQKAAERGREEYPEASKMISENSYMDDIVDSVPTVDLANKLTKNADSLLKNAGFKVKEWLE